MPSLIKTIQSYPAKQRSSPKHVFLLCGFGGSIWQLKRLINVLTRHGYNVMAMDFSKDVFSKGDATLLPQLVNEVVQTVEAKQKELNKPVLLVGVSLGALLSLNILRRSELFHKAVLITGGDIVKVAQRLYGPKVWPQTYEQLATIWQDVNMYTDPLLLKHKRAVMILPPKDQLIDPEDVRAEVRTQRTAGNQMDIIERPLFGHVGTIIEEAVLFPGRVHQYIERLH